VVSARRDCGCTPPDEWMNPLARGLIRTKRNFLCRARETFRAEWGFVGRIKCVLLNQEMWLKESEWVCAVKWAPFSQKFTVRGEFCVFSHKSGNNCRLKKSRRMLWIFIEIQ
jgi:hypothetical protein